MAYGGYGGYGGYGAFDYAKWQKEDQERREKERAEHLAFQSTVDCIGDPEARLAEQRKRYKCGANFVTVGNVPTWTATCEVLATLPPPHTTKSDANAAKAAPVSYWAKDPLVLTPNDVARRFKPDAELNSKVSLWQGDITSLEVDAIVNAANNSLLGGGGIDGAIHAAAGPLLVVECEQLGGCDDGHTKMTRGYALPAKHVLHTVGPRGYGDKELESCYTTCLELIVRNKLRSVAFCCIGTGIFGFPLVRATHIALATVRKWLDVPGHRELVDRLIFCTFPDQDQECYERMMPGYFPLSEKFPAESTDKPAFAPEVPRPPFVGYGGLYAGGLPGGGTGDYAGQAHHRGAASGYSSRMTGGL